MEAQPSPRQRFNQHQNQRLAMTPALGQSLKVLSLRVGGVRKLAQDLARKNAFLEAHLPAAPNLQTPQGREAIDFDSFGHDAVRPVSLTQYVSEQIGLMFPRLDDKSLAFGLLEYLSPSGWLEDGAVDDVQAQGFESSRILAVLSRLQGMEPAGLFARNLRECLALQLADRGELTPLGESVLGHLDLIPQGIEVVAKATGASAVEVGEVLALLRRCNPKPGADFAIDEGDIFCPDLVITRQGSGFEVATHDEHLPKLVVRADEASDDEAEKILLAQARRDAEMLRQSLRHRQEMLLRAGAVLARQQRAFLRDGERGVQAFTMTALGDMLGVHKSTISRLVQDKLVATPRGMMEMSMFFSRGVAQPDGRVLASRAITAMISRMIDDEDSSKPISDSELTESLKAQGIIIARRTIAKYRQQGAIPPPHQRKGIIAAT